VNTLRTKHEVELFGPSLSRPAFPVFVQFSVQPSNSAPPSVPVKWPDTDWHDVSHATDVIAFLRDPPVHLELDDPFCNSVYGPGSAFQYLCGGTQHPQVWLAFTINTRRSRLRIQLSCKTDEGRDSEIVLPEDSEVGRNHFYARKWQLSGLLSRILTW